VTLGRRRGVPVVYDLGSGCLVDLAVAGLPPEPTVQASVASGADLVLFSGDKLLGGPQAGLIVGARAAVDRCRKHPLARAFRLDKLDLAALAATLRAYLDPDAAWREIPALRVLAESSRARRRRASRLAKAIASVLGAAAAVTVVETAGEVGGGSLPGVVIPSWAVAVAPATGRPEPWAARLRQAPVPVIARVRDGAVLIDVLALLPGDDRVLPALFAPFVHLA
jgi:L-seryl-tRNA(Ser) seleniumtransferase